ncbi:unnamed protein product [Trichobilharzia szidati]|nr:unnamed protein product [Trichobilharzia szidati]
MVSEHLPYLNNEYDFSGRKYDVVFYVEDISHGKIEITDRITLEEWHATLSNTFVEELTRKTGNFKKFDVFCSMIQSAICKRSSFLKLDLLNYEDLSEIRKSRIINDYSVPQSPVLSKGNKRYLILSYTTEFDKIHYPIPLMFFGCPSPDTYRNNIHELRVKLYNNHPAMSILEQQSSGPEPYNALTKITKLQSENTALKQELRYVKECLSQMKANQKNHSHYDSHPYSEKLKQLGLKDLVNSLETELFEERSKSSRQMVEYTREIARLQADLEAATIDQRGLRRKVNQLSEELCFLKGGSVHRITGDFPSGQLIRSNQYDTMSRYQKNCLNQKPISSVLNTKLNKLTRRAGSASPTIYRSASHGSNTSNTACFKSSHYGRHRTNSLDRALSGSNRRFDPTAYVREKERQREENALKRKLAHRQSLIGTASRSSSNLDHRYNSEAKNTNYTRFARTSRTSSPVFSSCESGLESMSKTQQYSKINGKYDRIHSTYTTNNFNRSVSCSPRHSPLRSSRSPVNSYYSSNSPEPLYVNINQMNNHLRNHNKRDSPTPLNDINIYKSSKSRSTVENPRSSDSCHIDNEMDSDYSLCSGRLSRRSQPTNRHIHSRKKPTHDVDKDLDEIDHRLNVLQGFFEKYLLS